MNTTIGFMDSVFISIFCIIIVFIILSIIATIVSLFKIFTVKKYENLDINKEVYSKDKIIKSCENIDFEDIEDEEMRIAAFVASIDAVCDEDNKTVRIKSIREV